MPYTVIPPSSTVANKPITEELMSTFRTNQDFLLSLAVTNGNAHNHSAGDGAQIPGTGLIDFTAGEYLAINDAVERSTSSSSYVKLKEAGLGRDGTLRIRFGLENKYFGGTNTTSWAQIYRNGVAVGTARSRGTAGISFFEEDIAGWSEGDLVQIYGKAVGGTNPNSNIVLFEVKIGLPAELGLHTDY